MHVVEAVTPNDPALWVRSGDAFAFTLRLSALRVGLVRQDLVVPIQADRHGLVRVYTTK